MEEYNCLNETIRNLETYTIVEVPKDKFETIIKQFNQFKKNPFIRIQLKRNRNSENLNIHLNYKNNTEYNAMSYDLVFLIVLDNDYPKSIPVVKSLTAFSFPTVFDNRNLIFSIINHNWVNKVACNLVNPIEEIIQMIPKFINRLIENTNNKILVYYGDYVIDTIYDINDFLSNPDLDFYKVNQHMRSKKDKDQKIKKMRYVFLTDIYFLLLDAVPSSKNLAKLLFWGDIRQIVTCKGSSLSSDLSSETLILEWKNNGTKLIQFEMSFINRNIKEFLDKSTKKIHRLKEHYKIFQDDINKPNDNEIVSRMNDVNISNSNIEKLVLLVKYKEEILENGHSLNIIKELMSLYQQIIEILSAKGDPEFKIYLDKLHTMLNKVAEDNSNTSNETEDINNNK